VQLVIIVPSHSASRDCEKLGWIHGFGISALVVLEFAPGIEIVSTITTGSATDLKLKKGQTAYAIIKSSSVMIGSD
jgi:molybdopterin-binding protein